MADYVKTIKVQGVDKLIDYTALANLPNIDNLSGKIYNIEIALSGAIDFEIKSY